MRVLMVTSSYYPIKGGAEAVVQDFSIKLNEMGIRTDVMTFNMDQKWNAAWRGKIEKIDGVNVLKVPALNWFPMVHSDRITMKVNLIPGRFTNRLKDYDIIHFHDGDLSFPLFSYFVKKPKIFHLHGFSIEFYKRYFLSRFIFEHIADLYISLSELMERELIELGVPKDKIRCLRNAIDVEIFRPSGEKRDNLILFVGRITYLKGLHVLLESLRFLEKSIHLVIIGPQGWNLRYFESILKSIEKENEKGQHKVTYLGAQNRTNLIAWYRKASIFALPSFTEGFPVVNLEALSCETPVVATNVGGIPEVVREGENGILVPPGDSVRLAEAIQYLLDNEEISTKFGREGRKWVVKHFSLEVIVERLCKIYQEMFDH